MESKNRIFTCKTVKKDENELFITFLEENISLDNYEILDNNKNPNSNAQKVSNWI